MPPTKKKQPYAEQTQHADIITHIRRRILITRRNLQRRQTRQTNTQEAEYQEEEEEGHNGDEQ